MSDDTPHTFIRAIKSKIIEYFSLDLRSLALLRISLGILILADLFFRAQDLTAHYTDQGALPRYGLWGDVYQYGFSVHLINGTWIFQLLLFILAAIFAVSLIVGYRTWFATFVSWILLASIQNRNPFNGSGGDQLFALLLFWSLFLPLGAKYSMDSLRRNITLPKTIVNAATFAYIMQIFFLYFFTVLLKKGAPWRSDGTAVYYALNQSAFNTPIGAFLLNFPELLRISTFAVFAFEALGPYLLFFPYKTALVRTITVLSFMFMHFTFGFGLDLGLFSYIVVAGFTALLPSLFWDKLFQFLRNKKRTGLTIYYDYDCSFCKLASIGIKTFFLLPEVKILPAYDYPKIQKAMTKNDSWVVKDYQGKQYYKFEAFKPIFYASPLLWPFTFLLNLPPIKKLGEFLYRKVSARRKEIFCEVPGFNTKKYLVPNLILSKTLSVIIILLVAFVFYWNVSVFKRFNFLQTPPVKALAYTTRLNQNWNLFAPNPATSDSWFVFVGYLQSGKNVNLLYPNKPINFERPPRGDAIYKNTRWMKFYNSTTSANNINFKNYANYLCREWNKKHPEDPILKVGGNKLSQKIVLSGPPAPIRKASIISYCRR